MSRHLNIAIYHNLYEGGAKTLLRKLSINLKKRGYQLTLFTNNKPSTQEKNIYKKIYSKEVKKPKNMVDFYFNHLPNLWKKSRELAAYINMGNYDLVIVNHCSSMQTPLLTMMLNSTSISKSVYIFHELKREFYEQVSNDHYSIKRRLARYGRYFIKYFEKYNLKKFPCIISNSHYSRCYLHVKTGINSYCISPYIQSLFSHRTQTSNKKSHMYFTSGGNSYIKGYEITKQISVGLNKKIYVYCHGDTSQLKDNKKILFIKNKTINEIFKKKQNSVYMAHGINEPLGLMTLNALQYKSHIYALNLGANSELIKTGINGYLYPTNMNAIKKIFHINYSAPNTLLTQFDWKYYTKIFLIIATQKHEPSY